MVEFDGRQIANGAAKSTCDQSGLGSSYVIWRVKRECGDKCAGFRQGPDENGQRTPD
jgi:hypothetical protein